MIVTYFIDYLGISIPSEHSYPVQRHRQLLILSDNTDLNSTFATSIYIMTDEVSALVKSASSMEGYHHYLCAFYMNQLEIRVSYVFVQFLVEPKSNSVLKYKIYVYLRTRS